MKKIITLLLSITLMSGCSLGEDMTNTPTKKVEGYLNNYQTLNENVLTDLEDLISDMDYKDDQKDRYRDIMKKHYQDLTYEIKDEKIDGDNATVEAEIEVKDYSDILTTDKDKDEFKDDEGEYDESKYYDYQLDLLEKAKENGEWKLQEPSNTDKEKIHGIYVS